MPSNYGLCSIMFLEHFVFKYLVKICLFDPVGAAPECSSKAIAEGIRRIVPKVHMIHERRKFTLLNVLGNS